MRAFLSMVPLGNLSVQVKAWEYITSTSIDAFNLSFDNIHVVSGFQFIEIAVIGIIGFATVFVLKRHRYAREKGRDVQVFPLEKQTVLRQRSTNSNVN